MPSEIDEMRESLRAIAKRLTVLEHTVGVDFTEVKNALGRAYNSLEYIEAPEGYVQDIDWWKD